MAQWVNKAVPSIDRKNLLSLISLAENTRLMQQGRDQRRKRLAMCRDQANRMAGVRIDDQSVYSTDYTSFYNVVYRHAA